MYVVKNCWREQRRSRTRSTGHNSGEVKLVAQERLRLTNHDRLFISFWISGAAGVLWYIFAPNYIQSSSIHLRFFFPFNFVI
ncbi:hypothetical protein DL95DRAFT_86041 [Leptodontidium sp. 2 PMI_412]|nr:hypothetical protein DL95DRAFT_86041 [Leptodontidium sp. 2 PMI_412]